MKFTEMIIMLWIAEGNKLDDLKLSIMDLTTSFIKLKEKDLVIIKAMNWHLTDKGEKVVIEMKIAAKAEIM